MKRMRMPWFRLGVAFFSDPRMLTLDFANQRHFIGVLALRCDGALDDGADEELLNRIVAQRLWIDHALILDVKIRLLEADLIDINWHPTARGCINPRASDLRPLSRIWKGIRDRIFKRDDYTCAYCGARGVAMECDHVVPVARGGVHDDSNLTTACRTGNRSKRDKLLSEWSPA